MKILVVGAGMYVTGRDGSGTGTILSSLAEYSRTNALSEITLVATKEENGPKVRQELDRINKKLSTSLRVTYKALGNGIENYLKFVRESQFDLAIISTPDHLHATHVVPLLEAKTHCLIVKPLAPSLKEGRQIYDAQKKAGVHAAVEFHKRWDETNLLTKRDIKENKFGDLLYITIDYSQRIHIPLETFGSWSSRTNIFQYLGVHYVDLIYFLTGFVPTRLSAYGSSGILKDRGVNTFDSVSATIFWKKPGTDCHFVSQFAVHWVDPNSSPAMSDQRFKLIGTKGRIECDQRNRGITTLTHKGTEYPNPYFSDYLEDEDGGWKFQGYGFKSISSFLNDCLALKERRLTWNNLEDCRPSVKQSLVSTAAVEAANSSLAKQGEWVEIDDSSFA
jgi:predicted dehydrogenase